MSSDHMAQQVPPESQPVGEPYQEPEPECTPGVLVSLADQADAQRVAIEYLRDGLSRRDPRGRHLSIAITAYEDVALRLNAAAGLPVAP